MKTKFNVAIAFIVIINLTSCYHYIPYAVKTQCCFDPTVQPPTVENKEILSSSEFSIYKDAKQAGTYYILPSKLGVIPLSSGAAEALSLERRDGQHMILVSAVSITSDLLEKGKQALNTANVPYTSVSYYPMTQVSVRTLTDPLDPTSISISLVHGASPSNLPYQTLIVLQASGASSIQSLKRLVAQNKGVILESSYPIYRIRDNNVVQDVVSMQVNIQNIDITSITQ